MNLPFFFPKMLHEGLNPQGHQWVRFGLSGKVCTALLKDCLTKKQEPMRKTRLLKRLVMFARTIGLLFILYGLFFMGSAARCRGQVGPVRIQISPANPSIAANGSQDV